MAARYDMHVGDGRKIASVTVMVGGKSWVRNSQVTVHIILSIFEFPESFYREPVADRSKHVHIMVNDGYLHPKR